MHKLLNDFRDIELEPYFAEFEKLIAERDQHAKQGHGLGAHFCKLLEQLPAIAPASIDLEGDTLRIGEAAQLSDSERQKLKETLLGLHPWRKGPFELFGIEIDTEWNSALKWNRLAAHITPLERRKILDIGSSSGYYLFKMAAQNPRMILGVEPFIAYYYQYLAIQHFAQIPRTYTIPCRLEDLPHMPNYFDTIFCMGILYHRRSPLDFLRQMQQLLSNQGELVLETLTIPGDQEISLTPQKRYAKMHNIFFLPTVPCLRLWLEKCGFCDIEFVSTVVTDSSEQRQTEWIRTESLADFLDPEDPSKTIEGYPAPERTIFVAKKKS